MHLNYECCVCEKFYETFGTANAETTRKDELVSQLNLDEPRDANADADADGYELASRRQKKKAKPRYGMALKCDAL